MPHGGGGGSSGGGFHGSGGSGSARQTYSRNHPFIGARRYVFIDAFGRQQSFYSSEKPKKKPLITYLLGPILFIVIAVFVFIVICVSMYPTKLNENECEYKSTMIYDYANIIDDESEIEVLCDQFYEKTGIQPIILTDTETHHLSLNYTFDLDGLDDRSYSFYVNNYSDEGHWLFYIVTSSDSIDQTMAYHMIGNNTDKILTDKFREEVFNKFIYSLDDLSYEASLEKMMEYANEISMTVEMIDYGPIIAVGIFSLLFLVAGISSIKSEYQHYKDNKAYCEQRDANGGKDNVYDVDPKEYEINNNDF